MQNFVTHPALPHPAGRRAASATALRTRLLPAFLLALGLLAVRARAQSFDWATHLTNTSRKTAVVADKDGYTYVLSAFTGKVTVDGTTYSSYGAGDLLLTCYHSNGSVRWYRRIGGTGDEQPGDLTLTVSGNSLYVTGSFQSTVRFEDSDLTVDAKLTSAGQSDVFVARYTTGGYFNWVRQSGGTGDDLGYGIGLDKSDHVYLTGSFTGQMSWNAGATKLISKGSSDVFLLKYSPAGALVAVRALGGTGFDYGAAVAVHPESGDIYLTGGYAPAGYPYNTNVFVARYNAAGVLQWNKVLGAGTSVDAGSDILVAGSSIYVTGYFGGSIAFDGFTLTSSGSSDGFVARYYDDGKAQAAQKFGGAGWDEGQSLCYYNPGPSGSGSSVYLGGTFSGTVAFGKGNLTATGGAADRDMFLARLLTDCQADWSLKIGSAALDYGRGGIASPARNTIFYTGHYGAAFNLGMTYLPAAGSLSTKIYLPTITGFKLINAANDTPVKNILEGSEINYLLIGTNQINIGANIIGGSVGSVKWYIDGVEKIESGGAPFTYGGETPKAGGGFDYLPLALAPGPHQVSAVPFSGPNATGITGAARTVKFTLSNKPLLSDLTLVDAFLDADVGPMTNQQTISYTQIGTNQINVRANTKPGVVGSVKFVLNGVTRVENAAPYTCAGDAALPNGGTDYLPLSLVPAVYNKLTVTAYSGANATGTASDPIEVTFTVIPGDAYLRRAFTPAGPETSAVAFRVAPNPFSGRTTLSWVATEDGPATLEVYNAQGQPVARLFEGTVEKGKTYGWPFDGSTQPAGLYFARLKLGHQVLHQRLVLGK